MRRAGTSQKRLILWDIDGTLIRSGDVGAAVFDLALEQVTGRRPRARVTMSGKTDRQIVEEYLEMVGTPDPALILPVLQHLEHELSQRVDQMAAEGHACLGAEAVLRALSTIEGVEQTVLTGNIAPNARSKLSAFGLDRFLDLEVGAYGAEHSDRRQLLPVAWERQRSDRGTDYAPDETWIVGDTPNDLACARSGGAHCLLVATGRVGLAALEALAPDAVLADLTDTGRVLDILTG
jgi:phosphoglycolate phosphatase-like HAD superfamily hydrolase